MGSRSEQPIRCQDGLQDSNVGCILRPFVKILQPLVKQCVRTLQHKSCWIQRNPSSVSQPRNERNFPINDVKHVIWIPKSKRKK